MPSDATSSGTTGTGDLFVLADEMADAVGGPVILEDASFRVLAYSAFVGEMDRGRAEAILGRRIPDPWLEHLSATGSLARLRSSSDVVDLADGPWQARRRLITAVRVGGRQLGVVWVAEGDRPLPADAGQALREAANRAVPHLLRHLEQVDAAADRRARHVLALLDGHHLALAAAIELGLRPDSTFAVLALTSSAVTAPTPAPPPGPDTSGTDVVIEADEIWSRLLDHVALCCESFRRPAAVARFGRSVLAVATVPEAEGVEGTERLAQEIVRLAGSGPLAPLRAAVSSLGSGLASLPRLRDEAVGALDVLESEPTPRCATFGEVEAQVLVRAVTAQLSPDLNLDGLDRLIGHDARRDGNLVETLRVYLAACGSAAAAAEELGVHVTTLRHRLVRIADVSGLRLEQPEVRIACDLLLRRQALGA